MAQLWIESGSARVGEIAWSPAPLVGESVVPLLFSPEVVEADAEALLLCSRDGEDEAWLLLCVDTHAVTLNGETLRDGIRVLADRDEIRVAGRGRAFLSTERLARVEPFPGADRPIHCWRCKQCIEAGAAAVRCPSPACGVWFHSSAELPCWEYAPTCLCGQPTALGHGYCWTPEGL